MRILKINQDKPERGVLKEAIKVLQRGGTVVYPTDTAYGLGVDALNRKAVKQVYKIKGRKFTKPLPLIVSSLNMGQKWGYFTQRALELANKWWPGPLTLILKSKISDSGKLTTLQTRKRLKTVGLRVSNSLIARQLSQRLGRPITATSANISGERECYSAREVLKQFRDKKDQPDLILDGGSLKRVKPSTIVDMTGPTLKVLRQGPIQLKIKNSIKN